MCRSSKTSSISPHLTEIYVFVDGSNWYSPTDDAPIRFRIGSKIVGVGRAGGKAVCEFIKTQPRGSNVYWVIGVDPSFDNPNGDIPSSPESNYPDDCNFMRVAVDMDDRVSAIFLDVPPLKSASAP